MSSNDLQHFDTVIIGNGPSALILSYILHGHIPYYTGGHHDSILDRKLVERPSLLNITPDLYAHFQSSLRYSQQALPANILLDTLLRPNADIDPTSYKSCVEWRYEPERALPHLLLGKTSQAGGQWAENTVSASWEIGALSYAEQLTLPGYSFLSHHERIYGERLPDFVRPTRAEISSYYAAYPSAAGISDSIRNSTTVRDVHRTSSGFVIGSHNIECKHLVLASGIFDHVIHPPRLLSPLSSLNEPNLPLLVIGSGYSAADVIISAPPHRKILHVFQWDPEGRPSPLRGCHQSAYPEYAGVYRQMKLAAINSGRTRGAISSSSAKKKNPFFAQRDWPHVYEGLPNAEVFDVKVEGNMARLRIRLEDGDVVDRNVGGLQYMIGRRGDLDYLDVRLQTEVLGQANNTAINGDNWDDTAPLISARTLREKVEMDFEVAPNVFVIGSLAGDSLVRHAYGGCAYSAGRIMKAERATPQPPSLETALTSTINSSMFEKDVDSDSLIARANGTASLDSFVPALTSSCNGGKAMEGTAHCHNVLRLNQQEQLQEIEREDALNRAWQDTGWWGAPRWGFGNPM